MNDDTRMVAMPSNNVAMVAGGIVIGAVLLLALAWGGLRGYATH